MIETLLWTILAISLQASIALAIAHYVVMIANELVRWANE